MAELVILLGLVLSAVELPLALGVTHSGRLMLYWSDPVGAVVLLALAIDLAWHFRSLPRAYLACLAVLAVFFAWCATVTGVRFALGHSDLSSLIVPRAILMSCWVMLLALRVRLHPARLLLVAAAYSMLVLVVGLPLGFTRENISYTYWQSSSVRLIILLVLFPLHALAGEIWWRTRRSRILQVTALVHLGALILGTVLVGSRLNGLLVPLEFLVVVIAVARLAGRRAVRRFVAVAIVSLTVVYLLQPFSPVLRRGADRIPVVSEVFRLGPARGMAGQFSDIQMGGSRTANQLAKPSSNAASSAADSTSSRNQAWRGSFSAWMRNPVVGSGYRQIDVSYSRVSTRQFKMPPHNAVLEVGMAYGVVGVLLWLCVFAYPYLGHLRRGGRSRLGNVRRADTLMVMMAGAVAFGIGLFQPIFLNPTVLLAVFLVLAVAATARSPLGSRAQDAASKEADA